MILLDFHDLYLGFYIKIHFGPGYRKSRVQIKGTDIIPNMGYRSRKTKKMWTTENRVQIISQKWGTDQGKPRKCGLQDRLLERKVKLHGVTPGLASNARARNLDIVYMVIRMIRSA